MLIIRSSDPGIPLEFRAYGESDETYWAEILAPELKARVQVHSYNPGPESIDTFFTAVATQWRGWQGPLSWESLEGEVSIAASHDGVGRVHLKISIAEGAPDRWRLSCTIPVELGQLDDIQRQAADLARELYG